MHKNEALANPAENQIHPEILGRFLECFLKIRIGLHRSENRLDKSALCTKSLNGYVRDGR